VHDIGFGVAIGSTPLGSLPTIENNRQWLRDEQRYAVVIDFDLPDAEDGRNIRVGSQVSVIVYTGGNWLFNMIGKIHIRVASILSFAY
jgi:hypothetical protein